MHLAWQRWFWSVAIPMNNEGSHGRPMDALSDERAGLKPEMIFDAQMGLQQRVPRDGNTVKKCKDRVRGDRPRAGAGAAGRRSLASISVTTLCGRMCMIGSTPAKPPGPRSTTIRTAATGSSARIAW